jgi:hypothetical protein
MVAPATAKGAFRTRNDQTSGVFRQTVYLNQRAKSKFDMGGDLKIATPCTQGIIKWQNSTP